jgi:prepilin-type N-terminal cleavage/methylation domain-containing protein
MKLNKQSGFTLVEIAIVLVVIGLLLGGILKGQQLINSARVRNLADQNSGIQAAYYGFIDRFRNLPGDMLCTQAVTNIGVAVSSACATIDMGGDANGLIDQQEEIAAVWSHLSVAGFLNGTYSGLDAAGAQLTIANYRTTGVTAGGVPANAFQGPIMLAHSEDYVTGDDRDSVVRLTYSFGGNVPVPILRDLDQKLDDGTAGAGVVRSAAEVSDSGPGTFAGITDYTSGTVDCLTAGPPSVWNVDSSNQSCNAMYLY